jgi:DNA topoisomerase IB
VGSGTRWIYRIVDWHGLSSGVRTFPGYELFQYADNDGTHHTVDSADVNEYLREIANQDFTVKDFRTWAGSVLAWAMLREFEVFESETQAKKNVAEAIKAVASRPGNTPAVCLQGRSARLSKLCLQN